MLQVTDTGVQITLSGTPPANHTFVICCTLMVFTVAVAIALMTLSTQYAIGALFVLACGCFGFNLYRQHQKNTATTHIATGTLNIQPFTLIHNNKTIHFSKKVTTATNGTQLTLQDQDKTVIILGFENPKECQIVKSILLGATIDKKLATIKMQA